MVLITLFVAVSITNKRFCDAGTYTLPSFGAIAIALGLSPIGIVASDRPRSATSTAETVAAVLAT